MVNFFRRPPSSSFDSDRSLPAVFGDSSSSKNVSVDIGRPLTVADPMFGDSISSAVLFLTWE